MWETFEHTADVGLRVRAPDLSTLFAEAATGAMSIAVENLSQVTPTVTKKVELRAERYEDLLVDWLSEVLGMLEHRLVLARFAVNIEGDRLVANTAGEMLDPERHILGPEIKAVTYHALKVQKTDDGWVAEVVLDI